MFNFGWGEIVLIGIVALIAIGPKELPTVLRSVGKMMAKVRRMAAEFQGQFQEALREAEIADLKKQAEDLTSSVKDKVTDFTKFDPLSETKSDIEKAFDTPAGAPTRSSTRCSSGEDGGSWSAPSPSRTRQVEQRPRPPHTEGCGMPSARSISSTVAPARMVMIRPSP